MRVPLRWLNDFVDVSGIGLPQLVERLTLAGLEVASVKPIGLPAPEGLKAKIEERGPVWAADKIVIAEVQEVVKHPDADRLTLVRLDYGQPEPKQVVTGASNLKVGDRGQKVILALAGSVLYDGYAETKVLKELKPGKIRGILSDAMVCSAKELGIADEHEGIILLDPEAPVGMPLADYLGDFVLEIDILPNMARCLGLIGVAREVAALTGQALKRPAIDGQATGPSIVGQVDVNILEPERSGRYMARLITDVQIGPSPTWMQLRLSLAGMRPINNIVDVTNYVMLVWGQPLHAFDFDRLIERAGGGMPVIAIRSAREGESLRTLDGVDRKLNPSHLLIADAAGPIALAGVMGGADTEVTPQTRRILLETASFDYVSIRKTARHFDLPSEASFRFSRGIHPEIVRPASEHAAAWMQRFARGTMSRDALDVYPGPIHRDPIRLSKAYVDRLLGFSIPAEEIVRILRSLEYGVSQAGADEWLVQQPEHRLDIQHGPSDLVEDIARIHGYDRLPATLLSDQLPRQRNNVSLMAEERIADALADLGLQEVRNYSLTTPEREAPLHGAAVEYVRLANPISSERVVMRRSVLASVLEAAARNLRDRAGVQLFELGTIYEPVAGEPLPKESPRLAIVMTGPRQPEHWDTLDAPAPVDFFDLKGLVEAWLEGLHLGDVSYHPSNAGYLHPGQAAEARSGLQSLGHFGRLHPRLHEPFMLGQRIVLAGEFDLERIIALMPDSHAARPISTFPPVLQDIALIVDEGLPAAQLTEHIWIGGGELLRGVRLFDVYQGPNLPPGKKSLAFALCFQAEDRTLTEKEIAKVHSKIVSRVEKMAGAKLRGPGTAS